VTTPPFDALQSCKSEDFVAALSLAANGVAIVTTDGNHGRAGLTVSSIVSVCAEPALMLACVNSDNAFCGAAEKNQSFAINLLAEDQQEVSNVFAGFSDDTIADRFSIGEWTTTVTGSPILTNALVSLDCEFVESREHGTHHVYIGRALSVNSRDTNPLVYSRRNYAKLS